MVHLRVLNICSLLGLNAQASELLRTRSGFSSGTCGGGLNSCCLLDFGLLDHFLAIILTPVDPRRSLGGIFA